MSTIIASNPIGFTRELNGRRQICRTPGCGAVATIHTPANGVYKATHCRPCATTEFPSSELARRSA